MADRLKLQLKFKPFDERRDLELVLGWLIEAKQVTPDSKVDIECHKEVIDGINRWYE